MTLKLSDQERKVLCAALLRARETAGEIGDRVGVRESSVRRILNSLAERQIIRPYLLFDPYKLGYIEYVIHFKRMPTGTTTRELFFSLIRNHPDIAEVAKYGGDPQLRLIYYAKTSSDVGRFLNFLAEKCPGLDISVTIIEIESFTVYGCNYLDSSRNLDFISCKSTRERIEVDALDRQVLNILASSPLKSVRLVARELDSPSSTIHNRIKKMEDSGLIAGYAYWLQAEVISCNRFLLILETNIETAEQRKALAAFALKCPFVCSMISTLGSWRYEFRVEVERQEDLVKLQEDMLSSFGEWLTGIRVLTHLTDVNLRYYPSSFSAVSSIADEV